MGFIIWSKDYQDGGPLSILIGVNDDHSRDGDVFIICMDLYKPKQYIYIPILGFLTWSKDHPHWGPLFILIGDKGDPGRDHGVEGDVFRICITLKISY